MPRHPVFDSAFVQTALRASAAILGEANSSDRLRCLWIERIAFGMMPAMQGIKEKIQKLMANNGVDCKPMVESEIQRMFSAPTQKEAMRAIHAERRFVMNTNTEPKDSSAPAGED